MSRLRSNESFGTTLLLLFLFLTFSTLSSTALANEHLITIEQSQTPSSEYNSSSSSFPVELVSTPVHPPGGFGPGQSVQSGFGKEEEEDGMVVDFVVEKQHLHPLDEQGMFVLFYSCFHSLDLEL